MYQPTGKRLCKEKMKGGESNKNTLYAQIKHGGVVIKFLQSTQIPRSNLSPETTYSV
jgi:hypothetical protein